LSDSHPCGHISIERSSRLAVEVWSMGGDVCSVPYKIRYPHARASVASNYWDGRSRRT
jgi:hypothetical protein